MRKRKPTPRSKGMAHASAHKRAFLSAIIFEEFLRENFKTSPSFFLTVKKCEDDVVEILVRSLSGDKYEGYVMRSGVEPKKAIDNLMKYIRQEMKFERISK